MASARRALRWVVPLFVVLLALLTWCVTSAALRPVTRITRRVGEISDQGPTTGERVEVPRTRDELAALAARMNDLLDRIGRSARAQRAFTADAGHELRSPLAVLRSEHEQALAAASGASAATLARHSMPEIERLERIVEDLLELARIDEHTARRAAVPVDVDDVVLAEAMRRRRVLVDVRSVSAGQVLVGGARFEIRLPAAELSPEGQTPRASS